MQGDLAEQVQRGGGPEVIAGRAAQRQSAGRQRLGGAGIAGQGELRAHDGGRAPHAGRHSRGSEGQQPVQPPAAFGETAPDDPAGADRGADPQARLRVGLAQAPGERGEHVGRVDVVAAEDIDAGRPAGRDPGQPDGHIALRRAQHVVAERVLKAGRLAGLSQGRGRELPERVEHPVARVPEHRPLGHHQRLIHQRGDQRQNVPDRDALIGAHRLGHLQRPAREDRQPPEQGLLRGREQVITPLQGGAQGALARRSGPVAGRQQPEPVAQPGADLLRRQDPDPGRGQLDRQRQAVERPADRGDGGRVLRTDGKSRARRGAPVREQADGLVTERVPGRRVRARGRHRQGRHPPGGLARHAQRLAARHEYRQPRRAGQQPPDHLGTRVDQVLAVIQGQEQPARPQGVGERIQQRAPGFLADADGRGHPRDHQFRLLQIA